MSGITELDRKKVYYREYDKKRRHSLECRGLCKRCGTTEPKEDRKSCSLCLEKAKEYQRRKGGLVR